MEKPTEMNDTVYIVMEGEPYEGGGSILGVFASKYSAEKFLAEHKEDRDEELSYMWAVAKEYTVKH